MATIHASYRRTFQVKPYETETVELSITDEIDDPIGALGGAMTGRDAALIRLVSELHLSLALTGDRVVEERMAHAPRQPSQVFGQIQVRQDTW